MATRPDLLLPEPIKVFDHGLEARLERRREDWSNAQCEAKTHDAPDDLRMVMAALETHIVVELRVSGQAVLAPVGAQGIKNKRSRSHLRGPGGNVRSPKRPCGKDLEQPETFHPQVFDHVKGVYLGELLRGRGKIPARRWRGPTNPMVIIEQTVAAKNTSDCPHTGHNAEMRLAEEHLVNGLRTNEPQGAIGRELPAQGADLPFQDGLRLIGDSSWSVRASLPIHARQRLVAGSIQPSRYRAQSHPQTPRRLAL